MDFTSPAMIALYVILASFVVAFLYITIYGGRLSALSYQVTPDTFREEKKEEKKEESEAKPLYPQKVEISGYKIEPQPYMTNTSNELVKTTERTTCAIDGDCCSH